MDRKELVPALLVQELATELAVAKVGNVPPIQFSLVAAVEVLAALHISIVVVPALWMHAPWAPTTGVQVAVREQARSAEMHQIADLVAVVRADRECPPALQEPILFTVVVVVAAAVRAVAPLLFPADQEVLVAAVLVARQMWQQGLRLAQPEPLGQTQIQTPVAVAVAVATAITPVPLKRVHLQAVMVVQVWLLCAMRCPQHLNQLS